MWLSAILLCDDVDTFQKENVGPQDRFNLVILSTWLAMVWQLKHLIIVLR